MSKAFSPSCERNQQPILEQLVEHLKDSKRLLEIGSGTGQHAVYFAERLPHLTWYCSDAPDNHASINAWLAEANLANAVAPIAFHFGKNDWPALEVDAVFTANTTHIMPPSAAKLMMQTVAQQLPLGGVFCQYGPMNVNGEYTSEGNREFDLHLAQSGCGGIRDIDELKEWGAGLTLVDQIAMPANNFLLVWQRL